MEGIKPEAYWRKIKKERYMFYNLHR